jgi:hypothetical protein
LVFGRGTTVRGGNLVMAGAFSFHVVVVVGANEAPMLCCLGEGWLKLPSPVDAVRNSLVESSIVAPMKMAPSLPLLGDRLRPPKLSPMNSKFPRQIGSPRKNPPHARCSPSAVMEIEDDGTFGTSRGVARCKSPFLACQLSVFFCTDKI